MFTSVNEKINLSRGRNVKMQAGGGGQKIAKFHFF